MLFVQGTRDDFARGHLLDAVIGRLGERATLRRIEGGDHSFKVPRQAGRSADDVRAEVEGAVVRWLDERSL
jgi:predicted alpha/beta-hydrolase family hydrolase